MKEKKQKKNKRETVGKLARDLLLKQDKLDHSATEQANEQLSDYEKNIEECIRSGKKDHGQDFYVVVLTKKEKVMQNVLRHYFLSRLSCPTPNYDQIVYKYHYKNDNLEFIWVVPDRDTCIYMKRYTHLLDPSHYDLLSFVIKFADGSLFKLAKSLNGEKEDTIELKEN